jgi:predicted kinase
VSGRIVIVTGSPGAGKTTVSARLAAQSPRGVHLEGDAFYRLVAHLIAPVLPESRDQNATIIRAIMRAAAAYCAGGYDVFVDGIFGPWFLPLVAHELAATVAEVEYIVLRLDPERAVHRAGTRAAYPGDAAMVRQMNDAFARVGDYEGHVLDVGARAPHEVAAEIDRRRAARAFCLDLTLLRKTVPA